MKNLWPDQFPESDQPSPKALLEEQAKLLPKLTNDMVYATVNEIDRYDLLGSRLENSFGYRFDLRGKFLSGYVFNVLKFSYDITLYPVSFDLDDAIAEEIGIVSEFGGNYTTIEAPGDLEPFIRSVLQSKRIKTVVGSIIQLSR